MASLEAYKSQITDEIRTDVLTKARISCYKARDAFYSCLENKSDKKPTEIATVGLLYPVDCKKTRQEYVKRCRPTWVKHFDRQYCSKKKVQRHLDDNESRREETKDCSEKVRRVTPHSLGLNFSQGFNAWPQRGVASEFIALNIKKHPSKNKRLLNVPNP
ncbi:putative transcription factor bHLH66-like [Capsicum annuum]|uniref:Cytochrome c oxidase assembly factor 6 n=1 Tax=Capsicum annuum TaxID=4072 RepID=A0A2G2Z024_CAPAN|nr:putative transcription factor bHLH66-like [Capsicum annuum]KAF3634018.1 putative transcription factor bHLH66-like [Capsicum annuum]PHT75370.1 hypothetical protein T459_18892 [Capsicum annuum]